MIMWSFLIGKKSFITIHCRNTKICNWEIEFDSHNYKILYNHTIQTKYVSYYVIYIKMIGIMVNIRIYY
jgi:hypothetical protein